MAALTATLHRPAARDHLNAVATGHQTLLRPARAENQRTFNEDSDNMTQLAQCDLISSKLFIHTNLVSSPYTDQHNTLDLTDLPISSRLLALALTTLAPIRQDYATAPYLDAFNWDGVFLNLRTLAREADAEWQRHEFYVVIFRSTLKHGIDRDWLGKLDQESHREACESGGLLKYWFGECDNERRNLATCIWRSREDARAGGRGPWHARARAAAGEMYDQINFFTYRFVIGEGGERWWLEEMS